MAFVVIAVLALFELNILKCDLDALPINLMDTSTHK